MKNQLLFSIITPTYNCADFILRSYNNLKLQTETNWEWIVINDGSTDHSEAILTSLTDERIRLFSYKHNKGRGYARNMALSKVKAKIIVIWDVDDLYLPNRLKLISEAFKKGYDFFCSYVLVVNNKIEIKGGRHFYDSKYGLPRSFVHPTLAFNSKLLSKINYNPEMKTGEDIELMFLLTKNYKGCYCEEYLMLYFEDREVNLAKTIDMHKNHYKSLVKFTKNKTLIIPYKKLIRLFCYLKFKSLILCLFKIYPSLYLNSIKYRKLDQVYKKKMNNDISSLINNNLKKINKDA